MNINENTFKMTQEEVSFFSYKYSDFEIREIERMSLFDRMEANIRVLRRDVEMGYFDIDSVRPFIRKKFGNTAADAFDVFVRVRAEEARKYIAESIVQAFRGGRIHFAEDFGKVIWWSD